MSKTAAEIEERKAQINRLTDKLLGAVEGEDHRRLIDALLTAVVIVADTHRCCTRRAVDAALLAAGHLHLMAEKNAAETRPQGAPLH